MDPTTYVGLQITAGGATLTPEVRLLMACFRRTDWLNRSRNDAQFLNVVRCIRKIAKSDLFSFVMSIRPSAWNNSAPTGRIFMKFHSIFEKSFEKVQVSLKSDNNNRYFT